MLDRLTQLEDAHRALAAQHVALLELCRAILPLMSFPAKELGQALAEVTDRTNKHMAAAAMDAEYQTEVRKWLNVLSEAASAGCKSSGQRKDGN